MSREMLWAPNDRPIIHIVDDDESVRSALARLFRSVGLETRTYKSAIDFFNTGLVDTPGCIILDVRLPGASGLEVQPQLADRGIRMPIVLITGYGDIPMSVRAMKAGAVDFLTKPFRDQDILDAVGIAIEKDMARRREMAASDAVASLVDTLTPREREVMAAVVKGLMNKQIAYDLGISEITVK